MTFRVDNNGNISMTQGDSGKLVISGIDTYKNYKVYFAVQNKNRNPVGTEISLNSLNSPIVVFSLTSDYTNLFTVDSNKEYEIYYYGIKICDLEDNSEDTLNIMSNEIGAKNTITVFPKKVEGLVNG